jgi:hypothetical protein
MAQKPLCFVLMPFGQKPGLNGRIIEFDAVYKDLIAPAVAAAQLEVVRADEEASGGIIHKPMFERLLLCDFAVADLTTGNANVFYELGVRHAVLPRTTILMFAQEEGRLPFDVAPLRTLPYRIGPDGLPVDPAGTARQLAALLTEARANPVKDSPVHQLLPGYPPISATNADTFRQELDREAAVRTALQQAASQPDPRAAVAAIEAGLGDLRDLKIGLATCLIRSYRDLKQSAWADVVRVIDALDRDVAASVFLREQRAVALNRVGRGPEAETALLELIATHGPTSETFGILGRVYKDQWQAAVKSGSKALAKGLLSKMIQTYLQGFEADIRDPYPGVNAVTFMYVQDPDNRNLKALLPAVTYAARRKVTAGVADYWGHATLLELAVLGGEEDNAMASLGDALAQNPKPWEAATTLNNLRMIAAAREGRGTALAWTAEIEAELDRVAHPR